MNWYYRFEDRQDGPVNDETFEALVQSGVIRDDSLVWREGMPDWQTYLASRSASSGLQSAPAAPPGDGPPPYVPVHVVIADQPTSVSPVETPSAPVPTYSLYDSGAVTVAAIFGSPIAGGFLMALNYRRLGQDSNALGAFAVGLGLSLLGGLIGYLLPSGGGSAGVSIGLVMGIRQFAKRLDPTVGEHIARGGKIASKWAAFGIGLAWLAGILGVILGAVLGPDLLKSDPKVVVGTKDTIYYSGSATPEDAKALGEALKIAGYFSDRGVSVLLSKNGPTGAIVSFVVREGIWDKPEFVFGFEDIGRNIAPSMGGFPIKVRLVNSAKETKREMVVGRVNPGTKGDLFYFGKATEVEAKALGESLKSDGFFADRPATVMLSKGDSGTTLVFVVQDGYWENPAHVAAFEAVVRKAASSVGGLPITLQLASNKVEVKKEVVVR